MRIYRRHLQLASKSRTPQQSATPRTLPRGGLPPLALSDAGGRSPLRNIVLGRIPQCGRSPPWPRPRRHMTEVSWFKGTLVPHPLQTQILKTSWEGTHPSREQKEGGTPSETCSPNLSLMTTVSGLSGRANVWTCQPGGRSCRQSLT